MLNPREKSRSELRVLGKNEKNVPRGCESVTDKRNVSFSFTKNCRSGKIKQKAIIQDNGKTSLFYTHTYKHTVRHWVVILSYFIWRKLDISHWLTTKQCGLSVTELACPLEPLWRTRGTWGWLGGRWPEDLPHPLLCFFSDLSNSERQVPSKSSSCPSPYTHTLSWIFYLTFFFFFPCLLVTNSYPGIFQPEVLLYLSSWASSSKAQMTSAECGREQVSSHWAICQEKPVWTLLRLSTDHLDWSMAGSQETPSFSVEGRKGWGSPPLERVETGWHACSQCVSLLLHVEWEVESELWLIYIEASGPGSLKTALLCRLLGVPRNSSHILGVDRN